MTTESQRQQAETIAAEMAKLPGIASAVVDDWDDFGGFNLFSVSPQADPTRSSSTDDGKESRPLG
jgi:hypothetical protein